MRITKALAAGSTAIAAALLLAACGDSGNNAGSVEPTTNATATTATTTTSSPPADSEATTRDYSASATVPGSKASFKYRVKWDVSLGEAETDTTNQEPPLVNASAPVDGSATAENVTDGYEDNLGYRPLPIVAALYPKASSICKSRLNDLAGTWYGNGDLCAIAVARLLTPIESCGGQYSLASGESADLLVVPPGGESDPQPNCEATRGAQDPGRVYVAGLRPGAAKRVVANLSAPPKAWVLLAEGRKSRCSKEARAASVREGGFSGDATLLSTYDSQPSQTKGCVLQKQIWPFNT